MQDDIRYCTTSDGVQLAYSITGQGPPVVRALGWFTHLEYEWEVPFWRHYIERLSDHYTLIRYDGRGMGLSDRNIAGLTMDGFVEDLGAVIDAAGFEKVTVMGVSLGGYSAVKYTANNPDRVSHLIFYGSFVRNFVPEDQLVMFKTMVLQGWGSPVPAHRQFFSGLFMPDNPSANDLKAFNELQRVGAEAEMVATLYDQNPKWDARDDLPKIKVPTLVMHRKGDAIVPFEEGRGIAAKIPGARFVPLEGSNHALTEGEDATWDEMMQAIDKLVLGSQDEKKRDAGTSAFRTVLFTDLVGHTEMMQRLGDDKGRDVLREHERITRELLKAHGGIEVKTMGDGFMASFGSIAKALECAISLQRAFEEHNASRLGSVEGLHVRVGLNAGEPIDEDGDLFGSTVILASRIAAKAAGGEILVANAVRELSTGKGFLFADRGEFVAKGFEEPVRLYEVSWRHTTAS